MSRFKNEVIHLQSHVKTLRIAVLVILLIGLFMGFGWLRAPTKLTIHVPPDLRSGSTRLWWDVPPESVYTFSFYIFQQLNRWPADGEQDYSRNIHALSAYLTPACHAYLQSEYRIRYDTGELRKRVRGIYEIPGRGYGDNPTERVKQLTRDEWRVTLDVTADEYFGSEQVKRAFVRYPLKVVRMDVDPEKNPFGLALDCYSSAPQRIEISSSTPTTNALANQGE